MSLAIIILISLAIGWLFSKLHEGKWVKVKNPTPAQDPAHFWIKIRRVPYAFTGEQLQVARDRAASLKAK